MVNEIIGQDKLSTITDEIIEIKEQLSSVQQTPMKEYGTHVTYDEFSNAFNALNADV